MVSLGGKELGDSLGLKFGVDEELRVEEGSGGLVLDGPPLGVGPLWSSRSMPSIGGSNYKISVSSKDCHKYALGKR